MSFDRVAPFYRFLEISVFGEKLQKARLAFLGTIDPPRRVLIVGEGDGRFLREFRRVFPSCEIDCVEASARMIALARARVDGDGIRFLHIDLLEWVPPPGRYDLVVTHFFLDCFDERRLARVMQVIALVTESQAQWLVADFDTPPGPVASVVGRVLIALMYSFFRATAGLETARLVDPAPFISAHGFRCCAERMALSGLVRSQLWRRP